ncbi:MAG: ABC transporter permease [Cyclobacteriaceae bacterium]
MNKKNPPRRVLNLLQIFCKENYLEQIEGDLFELFDRERSIKKAQWKFRINALGFLRPRYLKGVDDFEQLTPIAMIKNYLKIAIRTLLKQKSYAGINIAGLAIGLASCLLIVMYITHERSYDKFYPDVERIYRVGVGERGAYSPPMLAKTMEQEYSQIEVATRISGLWETLFKIGDRSFMQSGAGFGDENTFKVFQTEFIYGDPETALTEPDNIVLTESLAKKCFPGELPMNKTIEVDGEVYQVTAVVKDPPKNTHFPYQFIAASLEPGHNNWTGNSVWTYAKTQIGVKQEEVNLKLQELYYKYAGPEIINFSGHSSFEEFMAENPNRYYGFTVHPVSSIHLHMPRLSMGPRGDYKNVIIFSVIAIFILLIACVNYINMATARSAVRSKEVGIRKAMGSHRKNIIVQFLVESMVITLIAVLIALLISGASIDYFNQLTGRQFTIDDLFSATNLLSIALLLVAVGLLAGVYPAYIISGFSPLKALRGQMQQAGKKSLRSWLVSFQFAISIFLVAATVVIYQQVTYMQSQELGVNIDQTLAIGNGTELGDKYELFKAELEKISGVQQVAKMSNIPFSFVGDWNYTIPEDNKREVGPSNVFVVDGAEKVLDIEMISGRFFDNNRVTDTAAVVINEALAKELGFNDPIGKVLSRGSGLDFTIIGVMKNFNYASLKREIGPLIYRYGNKHGEMGMWHQRYVIAKVNSSDILKTLDEIEDLWNEHVPNYPFDSEFLNDTFQRQYEGERKFGKVFTTFSLLAVFIAFLGLFALTTFVLQKRVKEIAVRKVLGATVPSLLRLMLKDFTRLVVIGGFVGVSVAFYWLEQWLQEYNYRIELAWYLLAIPVILVLILTWIVVSLKSYKAAIANPSNALKEE